MAGPAVVLVLVLGAAPPAGGAAAAAGAAAAPPRAEAALSVEQVLGQVRAANAGLRSWAASFVERREFVHFDTSEERRGRLAFRRGAGLRIDLDPPAGEVILVEPKTVRQLQPRTRQLHLFRRQPGAAGGSGSPIPVDLGDAAWDPRRDHAVILVPAPSGEVGLELVPREPGAAYAKRTVWLDRRTWLPIRVELVESTDDRVTFTFADVQVNPSLGDGLFRLEPPPGTEVIEHQDLPKL